MFELLGAEFHSVRPIGPQTLFDCGNLALWFPTGKMSFAFEEIVTPDTYARTR